LDDPFVSILPILLSDLRPWHLISHAFVPGANLFLIPLVSYILKGLDESGHEPQPKLTFQKNFTKNRLREFKMIFREIHNRKPFEDDTQKNLDAINAVNFALSDEAQGRRVAKEGLRSILKCKKERSR